MEIITKFKPIPDKYSSLDRLMCPLEFRQKWKLTIDEMSWVLQISPDTFKSWAVPETSAKSRKTPSIAFVACKALDTLWEQQGMPNVRVLMNLH